MSFPEFLLLVQQLTNREDVEHLFQRISGQTGYVSKEQMLYFLQHEQKEEAASMDWVEQVAWNFCNAASCYNVFCNAASCYNVFCMLLYFLQCCFLLLYLLQCCFKLLYFFKISFCFSQMTWVTTTISCPTYIKQGRNCFFSDTDVLAWGGM